ncbi:MAG: hypothetical protein WA885_17000 [Phormidesmis sp.]
MSQANHVSTDRAFVAISFVCVIAAVVAGFWLLGSPGRQRLLSLDQERVQDLSAIASDLQRATTNATGESTEPLPEQLPEYTLATEYARDPVTDEPYEYNRLSNTEYELCATFATAYDAQERDARRFIQPNWMHPAGRHCFELERGRLEPNP